MASDMKPRGWLTMRRLLVPICGLLLASASPTAFAFEEARGSAGDEAPQQATKAKRPLQKPALNLNGTGTSIETPASPANGPDIRIPGLGKLGVWPKLDFGLELLYGGRDDKASEADRIRPDGDDMQIRGSIKHRF